MGQVIPFPGRSDEEVDVDLLTAVDVAIRDLREVLRRWGEEGARQQADECRQMLEQVFDAHCCDTAHSP